MSSATPIDKKRRWATDNADTSTPNVSRPPLKKRFTANGSIGINNASQPSSTAVASTSSQPSSSDPSTSTNRPTDEELNLDYRGLSRDGLLKQMRKAKDDYLAVEQAVASLEAEGNDFAARRSMIRFEWAMIFNQLSLIGKALGVSHVSEMELPKGIEDVQLLSERLQNAQLATRSTAKDIVDLAQRWMSRNDRVHEEYNQKTDHSEMQHVLMDWIRHEVQDLLSSYEKTQMLVKEMDQQHKTIVNLAESATQDIHHAEEQLERAQNALDEYMDKLAQIEKRHDRSESAAVAAFLNAHPGAKATLQRDTSTSNSPAATTQENEPKNTPTQETDEQTAKEYQLIVDARSRELDDMQRERQQLIEQTERLRGKFLVLTDEQLMATEYFKMLQLSLEHYKSRAHYLEEIKSQLQYDLDEVTSERRKVVDEIKAEKVSQGMTMEGEMRRLENDLARIRKQRDDFQRVVDEHRAKKDKEKELHGAIVAEVEKEAKRMMDLERQLSELRSSAQSSIGIKEGLFTDLSSSYKDIYAKISDAKAILGLLTEKDEKQLGAEQETLQNYRDQFSAWKKTVDSRQDINALITKIDEKSNEQEKTNLMIQFYADNEAQLMTQIDRAGAIFSKLEEQNSKSEVGLAHMEEQRSRLQAEKAKFAHTFSSLKAAKDKQMGNVAALRRTSEQQLDHIRQLEDRERSLDSQVTEKEDQVRKTVQTLEEHRMSVEDLQQQCSEIRISLEHNDTLLHELQRMVKDKTRVLDEEKQLRKRVDEEFDKMQRKWNAISQSDSGVQDQLAEECENLRGMLKCSACRTRFRKKIITRCMHTFCQDCIDKRLETRQRRCPTCGESFGSGDVRPFIL